jgi:hypothetical protein
VNNGDVVVLRSDRVYENHGKIVPYYLVVGKYDRNIIKIYEPISTEVTAVLADDLILISSTRRH